ncbi:MAG: hypothetical protein CMD26_04275 [Flavobacteriales bacterium]|nr:hypothetical protein [Flavobacteriales bacterium]|tara:strand:- start:8204 stop:8752 length:549 start_codon:yes stop_codon:yes gene_type:complete
MLNQLKLNISNFLLRRHLSKKKHCPKLITLSEAKKVALVFDAEDLDSITEVKFLLKYFLKLNIDVYVLGFINSVKKDNNFISTLHINYFNSKDVSFFGIPNNLKTNSFLRNKFDLLINLSLKNSFPVKYMSLMSNAHFKIGMSYNNNDIDYDLIFKLKIKSLNYFIKNIIHYLEIINHNNEK